MRETKVRTSLTLDEFSNPETVKSQIDAILAEGIPDSIREIATLVRDFCEVSQTNFQFGNVSHAVFSGQEVTPIYSDAETGAAYDRERLAERTQMLDYALAALKVNGTTAAQETMIEVVALYDDKMSALDRALDLYDEFTAAALGAGQSAPVQQAAIAVRNLANEATGVPALLNRLLDKEADDLARERSVFERFDAAGLLSSSRLSDVFSAAKTIVTDQKNIWVRVEDLTAAQSAVFE